MTVTSVKQNKMGVLPVRKLLFSLAIPAVIANVINSIYSIVDQIFIGQGVGMLGNAATNVAFPVTTICLALGLMIGIGGAAGFGLRMGEGNRDQAKAVAGTAVSSVFIVGAIICLILNIFMQPLMTLFGATGDTLELACVYARITSFGVPFLMFTTGISALVRSDGASMYAMVSLVVGAAINTVLDAWFVLGLGWGMAGAAWATLIGQVVSAVIMLAYFKRFKSVQFRLKDFVPRFGVLKGICALGFSSFIFQFSTMIVQIVMNNQLKIYGAQSVYGSDIPIAVAGIVMKINVLFISVVIGFVQGSQPICSYNYGAKKYKRVRDTFRMLLTVVIGISIVAFAMFEIFPAPIISVFGDGSEEYYTFAVKYMRIFVMFLFLNGVQIASATFFPSIGKPLKGAIISVTKQLGFLLVLLFVLPAFLGLDGIIWATPVSDVLAFALSLGMLIAEFRKMPKEDVGDAEAEG